MKTMRHPASLKRGDRVDGWTVVRPLGSGTSGATFLVEKAGQLFLLKFATHREDLEDPKQANERARREMLCLLLMRGHPNVIGTHGSGHWPDLEHGWLYIILDHVKGLTLGPWVRSTHPTARQVVRLFVKLFATVAHLHARRVFHRSLTAGRILVCEDGEPLIHDFSAGEYVFTNLLKHEPPPGDGDDVLKASGDVHALGLCLYEVLTTALPEQRQRAGAAGTAPLPAAREVNPRVPELLSCVVMALMARESGPRVPTAAEAKRLLEDLASRDGEEWAVPLHRPEDVLVAEEQARVIPFPGR